MAGEDEEETREIMDMAQDVFNGVIDKLTFLDKDGSVDLSKLNLDYQVEGDDPDDQEGEDDEEEPSYPLQHYVNKIGWELVKHIS